MHHTLAHLRPVCDGYKLTHLELKAYIWLANRACWTRSAHEAPARGASCGCLCAGCVEGSDHPVHLDTVTDWNGAVTARVTEHKPICAA